MQFTPGGCPEDSVAPCGPLLVFFWTFLFQEAAAAATMQRELVAAAAARAAIAKTENFMVVLVGYVRVADFNRSARIIMLCLLLLYVQYHFNLSTLL